MIIRVSNFFRKELGTVNKIFIVITYPKYFNGKESINEKQRLNGFIEENPVRFPIANINGKILCISKDEFDKIEKKPIYSVDFRKLRNYQITSGQLTLPFKLRPKQGEADFQMNTDVTIGAHVGIRKRISKYNPTYLTIPLVLGLSFINVNENKTTNTGIEDFKSGKKPGCTWAIGFVAQTNRLSLGLVFGRDIARGYTEDGIYHSKTWYSFGIGYSFLK